MQYYNHTRINLKTAPASEPVTLEEAKEYLGITDSGLDNQVLSFLTSVRTSVEMFLGMSLITQTWQMFFDNFPTYARGLVLFHPVIIEIPKNPLQSVTSIKHYDKDDVATLIASTQYQVATYSATNPWEGRIAFKDTFTLPSPTNLRDLDALEIEFVAGYGTSKDVPEAIKSAILQESGYRYNNKDSGDVESEAVAGVYSVKYGSTKFNESLGLSKQTMDLLAPFRKIRI